MAENSSKLSTNADQEGLQESSEIITIRPIELSDADDLMVWVTDDRVSQYCVWDTYTSRDQALDYIQNMAIPHPWSKVICIDNRAIGAISVTPNSGKDKCRAELGYVLGYSYWGRGIVTRAVEMVISTVFDEWPYLERLEATVDVNNRASQRVLEKSGFQREGVLRKYRLLKGCSRDVVMYCFLATDRLKN